MRNEAHMNYEEWKATPEGQKCMDVAPMSSRLAFAAGAASRDAEIAELLADAMRYRWIKEQSDGRPFYFHAIGHKHAENLDTAIDAVLAKERKP